MHLDVTRSQRGSDLQSDEACAEHERAPRRLRPGDDRPRIRERAQHENVRLIGAGDVEANGFGAGCEQELVERHGSPICKRYLPGACIDGGDFGAKLEFDGLILVELARPQRHPVFRRVSGEIVLRAVGPVVRRRIVGGEERHRAGKSLPPQHFGGGKSGSPAAHDHHPLGLRARTFGCRAPAGGLDLLPHEQHAVALFHAPAGHRVERGRGERLARAQAEASVVPRAAHGVADDQPLGERTAVVRAGRADREKFVAAARE